MFNLSGPPRHVPIFIRVNNLLCGSSVFGWFLFGIGLAIVWGFTLKSDLTGWFYFRGQLKTSEGTILASEKTGGTREGPNGERVFVYWYHYSFIGPEGREYKGRSIEAGQELDKGARVTIEYPKGKPRISRIRGMSRSPIGLFGLMPVIFPLIGLCFIIKGLKKGARSNRLLQNGLQTTGKLISKVYTGVDVGSRRDGTAEPIYKLTFEFTAEDGKTYKTRVKTEKPQELENEAAEPLLYEPTNPSYAVMLDDLPGGPRVDEHGYIKTKSPIFTVVRAIVSLTFPAAVIIGHGTYIYLKFFAH